MYYEYEFGGLHYGDSKDFENPNNRARIIFRIIDPKTQKPVETTSNIDIDYEIYDKVKRDFETLGIGYHEYDRCNVMVLHHRDVKILLDQFKDRYAPLKYKSIKIAVFQFFDLIYRYKARNIKHKRHEKKKTIFESLHYSYWYTNAEFQLMDPHGSYVKFEVKFNGNDVDYERISEDMDRLEIQSFGIHSHVIGNQVQDVELHVFNQDECIKLIEINDKIASQNKKALISRIKNFFDLVSKNSDEVSASDEANDIPNPFTVEKKEVASAPDIETSEIYDPESHICKSAKRVHEYIKNLMLEKYNLVELAACTCNKRHSCIGIFQDNGVCKCNKGQDLNKYQRIIYDMTILGFTRGIDYEFLNQSIADEYGIEYLIGKGSETYIVFYSKEATLKMWHFTRTDDSKAKKNYDAIVDFFNQHS